MGSCSFFLTDVPAVAGARIYLTLTNPVDSGKSIRVNRLHGGGYAIAVATSKNSLKVSRCPNVGGGTLQPESAIFKMDTLQGPVAAEIRTGTTITGTPGEVLHSFPPALAITAVGPVPAVVNEVKFDVGQRPILREGESLIFHTAAGDADETFNMGLSWDERDP